MYRAKNQNVSSSEQITRFAQIASMTAPPASALPIPQQQLKKENN